MRARFVLKNREILFPFLILGRTHKTTKNPTILVGERLSYTNKTQKVKFEGWEAGEGIGPS